jgi:hypothetical protein
VSWSVYDELIEFRPGASRALASWLALGHILAACAVRLTVLPAALVPVVLFSLPWSLRRAARPLGRGVLALAWSAREGWQRVRIGNIRDSMELRGSSVVTNAAVFLHFDCGGAVWRVLLPRDSMSNDEWRRMKVIVGLHGGRARMPAAIGPGVRGARPHGHEEQRPAAGREGPAG